MGNQTLDVPPVTTRQLESLKRLVEARAKAEHRQIATENDALVSARPLLLRSVEHWLTNVVMSHLADRTSLRFSKRL